jgi:hypothetical protein
MVLVIHDDSLHLNFMVPFRMHANSVLYSALYWRILSQLFLLGKVFLAFSSQRRDPVSACKPDWSKMLIGQTALGRGRRRHAYGACAIRRVG